jgi:hypothetical protein
VSAVAEWGIGRVSASAKRDGSPATQSKHLAFLIDDFKISFDAKWAVAEDRDFCACHEILRGAMRIKKLYHDNRDARKDNATTILVGATFSSAER